MSRESRFYTRQIASILSFAVAVYGNFHYFLFNHHSSKYQTPFTGLFITDLIFWAIQYILQLSFVLQFFTKNESTTAEQQQRIDNVVGYHFIMNNLLSFFWFFFFKKHHFFISEVLLVVNLLNLLSLYVVHKTHGIKHINDWFTVHLSTAALPIAWTMYAIFWNGAILFHSHGRNFVMRVLANIFIWDFLLVPLSFLALFNDYGVGFATSLITLGVSINQFATRIIALQWIFAVVITSVVFLASALAASSDLFTRNTRTSDEEQAPLLTHN